MMNKKLLLGIIACCLLTVSQLVAQNIGINNPAPDPSALLDLTSTNKGFLPPRVALSSVAVAAPVVAPATGLLVYNTALTGIAPNNVIPGYYFWDGTKWDRFDTGDLAKDWSLNGNAGTNPITNFIGTTDNVSLNFRVNNTKAGGIDQIDENVFLGRGAGNGIPAGKNNLVLIGDSAGFSVNNANNSVLIGAGAVSNTTCFQHLPKLSRIGMEYRFQYNY